MKINDDLEIKNVIIIGAMKSGTTSLFHFLKQHPEICSSICKEPEYFSINIPGENPILKSKKYIDLFDFNTSKHKFTLEASTGYSKFPIESGVPSRIKEYGLDPYFVYILRNPLQRIESHYNFMKYVDINWDCEIDSTHLINTSNYYKQISEYENVFGKKKLKLILVDFDDILKYPELVCDKIYDFIGASKMRLNYKSEIRNVTPLYNINKIKIEKKTAFIIRKMPNLISKIYFKFLNLVFPPKKKKSLTKTQVQRVKKELMKDMLILKTEYNFDVSKWGFK